MSKKILKRSLTLGALMAFVITGNVWAAEDKIANGAIIQISSGDYDKVIGGNYFKEDNNFSMVCTNVTFDDGTAIEVLGGSRFNQRINATVITGETNLTINDGEFGGTSFSDCFEYLVAGGDHLKYYNNSNTTYACTSSIKDTNLTITGGTFNAMVIGGSIANEYYRNDAQANDKVSYMTVGITGTATTNITGGEFNHVIVAGGIAYGYNTISTVNKAVLNISGADTQINCDIYAGGLSGGLGVGPDVTYSNTVGTTEINIDGTQQQDFTVNNIYGTSGVINYNAGEWEYSREYRGAYKAQAVNTTLTITNVKAQTVDIPLGSVTIGVEDKGNTSISKLSLGNDVGLAITVDGETNDAINGEASKIATAKYITIGNEKDVVDNVTTVTLEAGEATDTIILTSDGEGGFNKEVIKNEGNTGISDISAVGLMAWRAETNDMNKRLGELRNANGEHGVWVRMVRGESEYNSVKNQYNQYQLGYDEKLSVDKSWTVGMALSYTDAESSFSQGSGENTHKGLAIYGSKLNDDGSFVDLIAKYSRLEHDFDLGEYKGDYDTNGYSVSAEYGKRFQQGNGMWIEPQVELTYGQVDSATYMVGGRTVNQDSMESLVGRVGFSFGKDIKQGNVYARASYLYDFEGETEARFAADASGQTFEQDLGGGWWEVGVGANINLSKATYIYADVEKTFGGEVDTNWQWNLGVRYSF